MEGKLSISFARRVVYALRYLLLVLTIGVTGVFIGQMYGLVATTDPSNSITYCTEVETKDQVICSDDMKEVEYFNQVNIYRVLFNALGFISFLSILTYMSFRLHKLLVDCEKENVFTDQSIKSLKVIVTVLVIVPFAYTMILKISEYILYNYIMDSAFLHGMVRGLQSVELFDFNLSTLILGIIIIFLVEVIRIGIRYQVDRDLTI